MAPITLLVAGATSIATGAAFALAAFLVARAKRSPEARLAGFAHATWWGALGFYLMLQGTLTLVAWQDALNASTYRAWRVVAIPALCAAVWGLSTYLAYLFTGSRRAAFGFLVFYAAAGALFFYVIFGQAQTLVIAPWLVGYEQVSVLHWIVYLAMGLPPIVGSIAYLTLLRKAVDPLQRFRIKLLGTSILAYIVTGIIVRTTTNDLVIFLTLVPCGVIAGVAALVAHAPPGRLMRWIQKPRSPPLGGRQADLEARIRDLV